jgi:membrane fusion protein (multidrug efflux system)
MLLALGQTAAAQNITAILEPVQLIELKPSVAGRLSTVGASEGTSVEKGTVLAAIDARVQEARLNLAMIAAEGTGSQDRAQIVIRQAEALLARITKARKRGAAQAWEVAQAEQALELARADARVVTETAASLRAQLQLEQATLSEFQITAPFAGTVLERIAEPGEIVGTNETIMEFGNLSRLRATAFVPVDWAKSLNVGDTVTAAVSTDANRSIGLEVVAIDPRIDPVSRSVRVLLEMDNSDKAVFAGTSISLNRP